MRLVEINSQISNKKAKKQLQPVEMLPDLKIKPKTVGKKKDKFSKSGFKAGDEK